MAFLLALALTACDVGADDGAGVLTAEGLLVGESVGLAGASTLLGAPGSDEVFFFDEAPDGWSRPIQRVPSATAADPFYGQYLALGDEFAVVGAPGGRDTDPGHAYVYARAGGEWTEVAALQPPALSPGARFGAAVAVSGGQVAVGVPSQACEVSDPSTSRPCGEVRVFDFGAGDAQAAAVLRAPVADRAFDFGSSVALDGDRLVVAAFAGEFGADGRLYVYERGPDAVWVLVDAVDAPPLPDSGRFTPLGFGIDLALDGDLLVVNEPGRDGGTVYAYRKGDQGWTLEQALSRGGGALGPLAVFGNRVDLSGDRLVAAVPARVYGGQSLGAAFVYVRGADGTWSEEAELRSSEPFIGFGRDVAIDGDRVLVGANNSGGGGQGFLFTRFGSAWTQSE